WAGFLSEDEAQNGPGWTVWLADLGRANRAAQLRTPQAALWIAAEQLPQFAALLPGAKLDPRIAPPVNRAGQIWTPETALVEILRGRLEALGPVSAEALAAPLGIESGRVRAALAAVEAEGFALRGRFTPQ